MKNKLLIDINERLNSLSDKIDRISKDLDFIINDVECYAYQNQLLSFASMQKEGESYDDAQKRFFTSLKATEPYMRIKQKGGLILLKQFINLCNRYNLRYWVSYGALLGAVRHNNFIPWDDDIDVCMPSKDYREFLKIAEDKDFQTVFWYHTMGAFRIKKLIFRNHKNDWFLDIFPFEESALSPVQAKDVYKKYKRILLDSLKEEKTILYDCWIDKEKLARLNNVYDGICAEYNDEVSNPNGKYFVNSVDGPEINLEKNGYALQKTDVFPLKTLQFNSEKVNVMNNYHRFLEEFYGDYMYLPKDIYTHRHLKNTVSAQYLIECERFLNEIRTRREL